MQDKRFDYNQLYHFSITVFIKIGCPETDAELITQTLLAADLRGIDSHGIARLPGYVRLWESGRVNPIPKVRILHETPSTATIDGDAGLGLLVAQQAMDIAMEKASQVGSGWVSVCNSNHFGIAAAHAMKALKKDMIGMAMTNASALVAPTHSKERMLGTNPIAIAIPAGNMPAFVADMATTTAANGKLEILQRKALPVPDGWVQDEDGVPSNDAHILKKKGAMLPLGSDPNHGSHKGYALGSIVDIFSAVLSGAAYGPWAPPFPAYVPMPENPPGKGLGHFLGAMRIDAFRPAKAFKADMDRWIQRFREARPIQPDQPVLIPGDPEREAEVNRRKTGIPLHASVINDLRDLADQLDIDQSPFSE